MVKEAQEFENRLNEHDEIVEQAIVSCHEQLEIPQNEWARPKKAGNIRCVHFHQEQCEENCCARGGASREAEVAAATQGENAAIPAVEQTAVESAEYEIVDDDDDARSFDSRDLSTWIGAQFEAHVAGSSKMQEGILDHRDANDPEQDPEREVQAALRAREGCDTGVNENEKRAKAEVIARGNRDRYHAERARRAVQRRISGFENAIVRDACFDCGQVGHLCSDCPLGVCHNCGLDGHSYAECPDEQRCWICRIGCHYHQSCTCRIETPAIHVCGACHTVQKLCVWESIIQCCSTLVRNKDNPAHGTQTCKDAYEPFISPSNNGKP